MNPDKKWSQIWVVVSETRSFIRKRCWESLIQTTQRVRECIHSHVWEFSVLFFWRELYNSCWVSIVDVSVLTNQCEDDHNKTRGNRLVSQTIEESSLVEVIVEKWLLWRMEEERGWLENSTQLEPVLLQISKSSFAHGYPFFLFLLVFIDYWTL